MVNRYGNNIECDFIKKIRIPIFDQQGATDNGTRYYFPENPQIDKNLIVGIEAHIQNYDLNVPDSATIGLASQLFFSFYNKNKEEIFYNVPYFSLFNNSLSPFKKKIKPFYNKLNCKMCYIFVPANSTVSLSKQIYAELTFYIKKTIN
jgi:hypothetical protein